MSFYGSIYYQIIDAFHRILVRNTGLEEIDFPEEEKIPVSGTEIIYRAPGRQGTINLQTGNRWLAFTKEGYKKMDENGSDKVDGVADSEKPYTIWHNAPDIENCVPMHGFQLLDNMFLVQIDPELGEESFEDAAARIIPPSKMVEGCKAVFIDTQESKEEDEDEEDSGPADGDEIIPPAGGDQLTSYALYELDENGEWAEIATDEYTIKILTPDDFFIATENATVDNAGHVVTTRPVYYKMPKSDVQEEIDKLKKRMDDNELLDEDQQELIEKHELSIGEWSENCGAIYNGDEIRDEDKWIPTISKAIGPIGLLIDGTEYTSAAYIEWYKNPTISITKAIGSLQELVDSYKSVDGLGVSKIEDISLVQILIALKDKIFAPLSSQVAIQGALLERHEKDITETILPGIEDLQKDVVDIFEDIEDLGDIHEGDMAEIHNPTTGILAQAKNYTDALENGAVADNAADIAAINDPSTGILINAKTYTDSLANGAVKDNTAAIAAINHTTSGILAQAKAYTDTLQNGAVADNTAAITAINSDTDGILVQAKNYADGQIANLNYTDTEAASGKYVSSVTESGGIITVVHTDLPTYTLTSGSSDGTVSFNNTDVIVKGLKSAAYAETSAFDPAGTAKSEAESQIKTLVEEGAVAANAQAIQDLELLLANYQEMVNKVEELERRIAALEPPTPDPSEPGSDPEEEEPDPEPTPDPEPEESGEETTT